MAGILEALSHVVGWLGLGSGVTVGLIALAFFMPRFAFSLAIAATVTAVVTFSYGKGVYDDYQLQKARTAEALRVELKKEDDARKEAEKYAAEHVPLPKPKPKKPPVKKPAPVGTPVPSTGGMHDSEIVGDTSKCWGPWCRGLPAVEGDYLQK